MQQLRKIIRGFRSQIFFQDNTSPLLRQLVGNFNEHEAKVLSFLNNGFKPRLGRQFGCQGSK
jgi:hypothetical protein